MDRRDPRRELRNPLALRATPCQRDLGTPVPRDLHSRRIDVALRRARRDRVRRWHRGRVCMRSHLHKTSGRVSTARSAASGRLIAFGGCRRFWLAASRLRCRCSADVSLTRDEGCAGGPGRRVLATASHCRLSQPSSQFEHDARRRARSIAPPPLVQHPRAPVLAVDVSARTAEAVE
jgi:hypothetical protein